MTQIKVKWDGIYPAVLTPFHENGAIDYAMFIKNLKVQIDAGVQGVIIGGSLGEASTLSDSEIFDLANCAKENAPEDFPVLVNLAETSTHNAIRFAKEAESAGVDGLMLLPPLMYKASEREVVAYFSAVASATSLPILIYNNPVDYGTHVTVDMFAALENQPTIQAVKESTRDLTNVTRMINRFGDRFKILGGVDTISMETQLLGGQGLVAGLVNAFPYETVAIFELVKAGKLEEALKIYRWFMPLLELDIHPRLVQYIKLAATAEGISTPFVRAPRLQLEGEEKRRIEKIIDEGRANRPDLSKLGFKNPNLVQVV